MAGPSAIAAVPWLMYFIFSVCTLFAIPFVYFCIPETRGLSLEELEFVFKDGPVRLSGKRNKAEWKRRIADGGGLDSEASGAAVKHIRHAEGQTITPESESKEIVDTQLEFTGARKE
jgi:hypothetical protein